MRPHSLEVKLHGIFHVLANLLFGGSGSDTPIDIRRVSGKPRARFLNHNQILQFLILACLKMLFLVPGAMSSLGFPATVTHPGFSECRN